jgi:hypothetical protein
MRVRLATVLVLSMAVFAWTQGARADAPPAGSGYVLACQGGGDMHISGGGAVIGGPSFFTVTFAAATQGANAAPPEPGTCAWLDRPLRPGEPLALTIPNDLNQVDQLKQAINGGTFQVHANNQGQDLLANQIDDVQVAAPAEGTGTDTTGNDATDNGTAGTTDTTGAGGAAVLMPPIQENGQGQTVTILRAVNVHVAGALSAQVIGSLAANKTVTLLGCSEQWCHVQFTGGDGWVSQSFLDVK